MAGEISSAVAPQCAHVAQAQHHAVEADPHAVKAEPEDDIVAARMLCLRAYPQYVTT